MEVQSCLVATQYHKFVKKQSTLSDYFDEQPLELGENETILSDNIKTGDSVNFPIVKTCRPSKICMEECYASNLAKPITWKNVLRKQLRVFHYFQSNPAPVVAQRVISEYHRKKLDWLRFCGSGDLTSEIVNVINQIAILDPELVAVIVSRKPEMVNKLVDHPNFFIMFSLDNSCKERRFKLKPNSRVYYSYLRLEADEDTCGAAIIFNEQKKKHELPYDDKYRVCPVDAGVIPVKGACASCRKCFSERVFEYQQEVVGERQAT